METQIAPQVISDLFPVDGRLIVYLEVVIFTNLEESQFMASRDILNIPGSWQVA
jgi:hypothetical protein